MRNYVFENIQIIVVICQTLLQFYAIIFKFTSSQIKSSQNISQHLDFNGKEVKLLYRYLISGRNSHNFTSQSENVLLNAM